MALSLLHQTVSHVGPTFTPDLTVNGWFTLHWYDDAHLFINPPTALLGLANGQEFVIDIVKHITGDVPATDKFVNWDSVYRGVVVGPDLQRTTYGLWNGGNIDWMSHIGRRLHMFWLNGVAGLQSTVMIEAY